MDLRHLDEIATAATVSPIEADLDGWWCKAAPDLPFRRCNVARPPVDSAEDRMIFVDRLDQVRRWYHRQGLRLIVQVSSALPECELVDDWLAAQGLAVEAPVHVLVADIARASSGVDVEDSSTGPRVPVTAGVDSAWAHANGVIHGGDPVQQARTEAYGRMLAALGVRALGASRSIDGRVAGVGFGVLDQGWLGIFGMGTAVDHRRTGIASGVVRALEAVAAERGAERSYLQVEVDNGPALALYERLGFERSHDYHYRSEPASPGAGG